MVGRGLNVQAKERHTVFHCEFSKRSNVSRVTMNQGDLHLLAYPNVARWSINVAGAGLCIARVKLDQLRHQQLTKLYRLESIY